MNDHQYSKLVDEAIDALPERRYNVSANGHSYCSTVPVLEDEAETKLLILAIADQADLPKDVTDKLAKALGIEPLKPLE